MNQHKHKKLILGFESVPRKKNQPNKTRISPNKNQNNNVPLPEIRKPTHFQKALPKILISQIIKKKKKNISNKNPNFFKQRHNKTEEEEEKQK